MSTEEALLTAGTQYEVRPPFDASNAAEILSKLLEKVLAQLRTTLDAEIG